MSIWIEIKNSDNVEISPDGKTIDVLYKTSNQGNHYIEIPIEFIQPKIKNRCDHKSVRHAFRAYECTDCGAIIKPNKKEKP